MAKKPIVPTDPRHPRPDGGRSTATSTEKPKPSTKKK